MAIGFKKFIVGRDEAIDSIIDYLTDPQARGDYYTEGGQAVLRWLATPRLQRLFALGGPVVLGKTAMRMLLEGRHPVTGDLIRRWGPNGTIVGGIDITLSPAPKSVSVLWALADTELRNEIERMVWFAADLAVFELMKKPLVRQRSGRGSTDIRHDAMEDIIGVQTLHTTARLSERGDGVPDPQLHVHSLLMGAVDATGQLRALDSRQMMIHQREIDAFAGATLAEMFLMRGFPIARAVDARGRVTWELADIPAAVLRIASSRRLEIIAEGPGSLRDQFRIYCRERFGMEREPQGQAWEDFLAAHRGPKATLHGWELRQAWADQYKAAGWGLPAAHEYVVGAGRRAQVGITSSDDRGDAIERFREEFLADLCREHALVPQSHVDALTYEKAMGLIDVTTALSVVGAMFSDGDVLVALDGRVTTLTVVAQEQRARRAARQLLDAAPAQAPSPDAVRRAIEEAALRGLPFDEHQSAAVRLATSGSRFVSITGQAGTGKGVTSGVIAPLMQALGREVIALAVAGRTAQQAGHDARADLAKTIDGLIYAVENGHRTIDSSTVLVVDEAAMIDHARYAALLEVAARGGATVIQVGDDRQLSPVGPGGLWTLIHSAAEERGQATELRVVRRAHERAEARAWTDVRAGRVIEALQHWQERGRLRLYDSRRELLAGMVAEWWADAARGMMVVDTSNAERDDINRLAQDRRTQAGELGVDELMLESGSRVRSGDKVIFRESREVRSQARAGRLPRIENGTEATVTNVDTALGLVHLVLHEPHGERTVTVGSDVVLNLAYARHVQLGQGMTVEGAGQVGVSMSTDRERFYVMVSRARSGAVVHAVRSEVAALAVPGLGPVTDAQTEALRKLGLNEIPDEWTWADASIEIDTRTASPLGEWAMAHLTERMRVDPTLAAHIVTQAIGRRGADSLDLDTVADSVRRVVAGMQGAGDSHLATWEGLVRDLQIRREVLETRQGLAHLLSRERRKEAVGDLPVAVDGLSDEARRVHRDAVLNARDSRLADLDAVLIRTSRRQPLELPLPHREPDLVTLRFDDGVEVGRGQVIRFGQPDWLAGTARSEVRPGDVGVVLGCHRGGVTWDYATVELVGGRRIEVWQTAQGITVEPELPPAAVRKAIPRTDQRDPAAWNVFELINGARLIVGDRVRFVETATPPGSGVVDPGTEGVVTEVDRHRNNRAHVRLDDGRTVGIHPLAPLEIAEPAREATHPEDQRQQDPVASTEARPEGGARPLPAANPLELVARWEAAERLPRALALYDALGQLHVSATPIEDVARLWLADQRAAIVVQAWEDAASVHDVIATTAGTSPQAPVVLIAEAAYRSRMEAGHRGDPPLHVERAYVLADLDDGEALTKALSVARESHLVIEPPNALTLELQALHAQEIAVSLTHYDAKAADPRPAADRALQLALESGRAREEARRQAERQIAGHELERSGW